MKLLIVITFGAFGTREDIYKTFSRVNREIIIENIEYPNTEDQHITGVLVDEIICESKDKKDIQISVEKFINDNDFLLSQECYGIYDSEEAKKENLLYTEEDLFETK